MEYYEAVNRPFQEVLDESKKYLELLSIKKEIKVLFFEMYGFPVSLKRLNSFNTIAKAKRGLAQTVANKDKYSCQ